ncbi:ubiquinol-cytochrome c reductase iron-sulfur subunit [Amycolatopsis sp. QT-25]|uniref:cytochrome bc1 complex Rieske iron-sulfur subunit n=1 Tax=Amycolatopsis sp. QT-25 TaxID=3034022 RepID=UPI0023EBD0A5|nr:ubiquinol-cytochrome c reductase iron-sulfur subunit [Amycolatopsis sp. QT-25]WET77586.1 ubiquinol-cytochrome c reductase iron-sulfur subunit [Amycolatopsis sp. QT-25]
MSAEGPKPPTEAELADMDRDQLVKLGTALDGVEIIEYPTPWPVEGTKAEKRAERAVALWFVLAALSGLAFVVLLAWPHWFEYKEPGKTGYTLYTLYTPLLGVTLGVAVLAIGVGAVLYTKKFIPAEVSIQERGDGGSKEVDKATILAQLADSGSRSTIARRSMIKRSAGAGAGVLGLAVAALPIASFIKDPWKDTENRDSLWHSGWKKNFPDEVVYLRRNTGRPHEISLVKAEDLDAGAMETVFPYRKSEEHDEHALSAAFKRVDNPVMLIRLRPTDAAKVVKRQGQEDYNFGDYYAYTKICSHVGCPTSLYEQRTNRILCPCHQSQFDALHYAKPIFGPATRPLAQLPITVDSEGYLIARGDFNEAVGPAFWERKS